MRGPRFTQRKSGTWMAKIPVEMHVTRHEWEQLKTVAASNGQTPREYLDMAITNLQIHIADEYQALRDGDPEDEEEDEAA